MSELKDKNQRKVYIETFGCQMNVSDTERVATSLDRQGFSISDTAENADVVLLNTCSVRAKAENKVYTRVGEFEHTARLEQRRKPLIGVMGCVAQLEGEELLKRGAGIDFVIGTRAVGRVSEAIEHALQGEKFFDLGEREKDYNWQVDGMHQNSPYVAFVPITEGCNKFCTYCIVPFARGRERSLSSENIVREVERLLAQGVKEVHLIGQNVNSYRPQNDTFLNGYKGATPFSKLLRAVAATGFPRIKFTTSFPRDFHRDIVEAIDEYENLCNWVHLPVQSGSDRVLKLMRRGHTIEDYKRRADFIRSSRRNIILSTDLIVGFPGESDNDFDQTMELVEYCRFDSMYAFKYSPRNGTPAYSMDDSVPEAVKTERFKRLEQLHAKHRAASLANGVGKVFDVLVEGFSSKSSGSVKGHTTCHRLVNFEGDSKLFGQIVEVLVTEHKNNTLKGKLID